MRSSLVILIVLAGCGRTAVYDEVPVIVPTLVPFCGDGKVAPDEQCDDGNNSAVDVCLPNCERARCGDGLVFLGAEQCDQPDRDVCTASCGPVGCGDGMVRTGEQCDDGNGVNTDDCLSSCLSARCGDGFLHAKVEDCDDGNQNDDDGCGNDCLIPVCGDGEVEGGEQCDLGPDNGDRPAFLISQASGTRIATNPLVRAKSAVAFYDYRSASSHTGLEQVGESRIYLYVDANTAQLSLVLTHGIDGDLGGGQQPDATVNMEVEGLPPGTKVELSDDTPGEFQLTTPTTARGRWTFTRNSDGAVLGPLPFPGKWKITVTPDFQKGITSWGYVRHDALRIGLVRTEAITIESFDQSSFCRKDCRAVRCGDGVLDAGEVCDDGNAVGGDGCAADCRSLK